MIFTLLSVIMHFDHKHNSSLILQQEELGKIIKTTITSRLSFDLKCFLSFYETLIGVFLVTDGFAMDNIEESCIVIACLLMLTRHVPTMMTRQPLATLRLLWRIMAGFIMATTKRTLCYTCNVKYNKKSIRQERGSFASSSIFAEPYPYEREMLKKYVTASSHSATAASAVAAVSRNNYSKRDINPPLLPQPPRILKDDSDKDRILTRVHFVNTSIDGQNSSADVIKSRGACYGGEKSFLFTPVKRRLESLRGKNRQLLFPNSSTTTGMADSEFAPIEAPIQHPADLVCSCSGTTRADTTGANWKIARDCISMTVHIHHQTRHDLVVTYPSTSSAYAMIICPNALAATIYSMQLTI
jgi:hypothetical protein